MQNRAAMNNEVFLRKKVSATPPAIEKKAMANLPLSLSTIFMLYFREGWFPISALVDPGLKFLIEGTAANTLRIFFRNRTPIYYRSKPCGFHMRGKGGHWTN